MEEGKKAAAQEPAEGAEAPKKNDCFADFDGSKTEIRIEDMFRSGVHFGHHKSRKNPKMDEYVFGVKNNISIIDLQKTAAKLKEALAFMEKTVAEGKDILFVGTKKQSKSLIESAARRAGMPFVVDRWLGGTFTNFENISKRTRYLKGGQEKLEKGEFGKYTKFEQMKISEELDRLEEKMGGIKHMDKLPGAVLVTGMVEDKLAIREARAKGVPVVALADTNANPSDADYIIPANDDAVSSLKLMLGYAIKAILDGKGKMIKPAPAEAKKPEAKAAEDKK